MIRPTPEQRAEMAAFIDAKQPGLLDDLGIERDDMKAHPYVRLSGTNYCANRECGLAEFAAVHRGME